MVTTRSQAQCQPKSVRRNSGDSSSSSSLGSSADKRRGRRLSPPATGDAAAHPRRLPLSLEMPAEGERLGRGCRVHRETRTLDEEYLQRVINVKQHPGDGMPHERGHPQEIVINQRYPEREAAKLAMYRLKDTLDEMREEDEESLGKSSESDGSRGRRRRGRNRKHSDEEDSSSSSSSSSVTALSSRPSTQQPHHKPVRSQIQHYESIRSPDFAVSQTSLASSSATGFAKGRYGNSNNNNGKRPREVSVDSSITDDSLREESIDKLAREDAKLNSSSGDDDVSSSEDERHLTLEESRKAKRHARESTARNININYYLNDAVGKKDEAKARRKKIDRRYRHLFVKDRDERSAAGATTSSAGGGGGGGGMGADEPFSSGGGSGASPPSGALGDISPLRVDDGTTFDSVGGLPEHIVTLREMVLLPLLYPDLFRRMNLSPPRGILFVGPPGTGKTLMARALANEGSRCGPRKVTFFMRKGADILSKWVGESERQLSLLFEEAKRMQPSIIFFDEIDGLAPTRHTKTEQTQAALVATFLALLDGLQDRGQVVVIGATNRPDTIDPALRRPGRFDRELIFPTPGSAARRHILSILAGPLLPDPGSPDHADTLNELVAHTEGYSGADMKALCTEASLNRLRTTLPQLYTTSTRLRIPDEISQFADSMHVRKEDFFVAAQRIHPALQRSSANTRAAPMPEHVEVLFQDVRKAVMERLSKLWASTARILEMEKRDCVDVHAAVRELTRFTVPRPRHPMLLLVALEDRESAQEGNDGAASVGAMRSDNKRKPSGKKCKKQVDTHTTEDEGEEGDNGAVADAEAMRVATQHRLTLMNTCATIMKSLTGFRAITVDLPNVVVNFMEAARHSVDSAAWGGGLYVDHFTSGHMYQLVQSIQRSTPCVVQLRGVEEWIQENEEDEAEGGSGEDAEGKNNSESGADEDDDTTKHSRRSCASVLAATAAAKKKKLKAFHYYLNMLAGSEVLLLVPCARPRTMQALIGVDSLPDIDEQKKIEAMPVASDTNSVKSKLTKACSVTPAAAQMQTIFAGNCLHPQFHVALARVRTRPTPEALERFVSHIFRVCALTLRMQAASIATIIGSNDAHNKRGGNLASGTATSAVVLEEDLVMPLPPRLSHSQRRAQHQQQLALWRRVEYRRLQLRHVLLKWTSQYFTNNRFKLLNNADLDLFPEHPLYKDWRTHTRGHRIGLQDVMEKVENEEYVCLSQYHDDIDQLVRNVRSFFRSRAPADQRYRLKALELKETTVLNLYRINRGVVRFCEEHQHITEPHFSSDEDEDEGDEDERRRRAADTALVGEDDDPAVTAARAKVALHFSQRAHPPVDEAVKRKKTYWNRPFGARRRKRRRVSPTAAAKPMQSEKNKDDSNEGEVEEGHEHEDAIHDEEDVLLPHDAEGHESQRGDARRPSSNGSSASSHSETPLSPLHPLGASLQAWGARLLSSLCYEQLEEVFSSVMRALEIRVLARDAAVFTRVNSEKKEKEESTDGGAGLTVVSEEALGVEVEGREEEGHSPDMKARGSEQQPLRTPQSKRGSIHSGDHDSSSSKRGISRFSSLLSSPPPPPAAASPASALFPLPKRQQQQQQKRRPSMDAEECVSNFFTQSLMDAVKALAVGRERRNVAAEVTADDAHRDSGGSRSPRSSSASGSGASNGRRSS